MFNEALDLAEETIKEVHLRADTYCKDKYYKKRGGGSELWFLLNLKPFSKTTKLLSNET